MKITIEIDTKEAADVYLSLLSYGILNAIEEDLITYDDAMSVLYSPWGIEELAEISSELGNAVHLGTELEDVASLVPHKIANSIQEIKNLNKDSLNKSLDKMRSTREQHVFYKKGQ